MSRLQGLKGFIYQRLTAAVEEIIGHLERTVTEYEEEMERRLLGTVSNSEEVTPVFSAEVQQHFVIKEESPSEQEWSSSLDQECPHIEEENQCFWTSQEVRGQQQGLHEEDITNFPLTNVSVKSEEDEAKASHQKQTEENREAEPPASGSAEHMTTEADGQETDRNSGSGLKCVFVSDDKTSHSSEAVTEGSADDLKETSRPPSGLHTIKNKVPVNDVAGNTGNKSFCCSKCGKRFGQKHHLQTHMRCHTGEKPFSCSLCGKRFTQKGNLTQHLTIHTRVKPCSCPVCGERFAQKGNLTQHMTVHTREKLISISFMTKDSVNIHRENPK